MAAWRRGEPAVKLKTAAALAALVLALTALGLVVSGCTIEYGLDTNVETDGSGTVGIRLAADKELQDALSGASDSLGGLGDLGDLGNLGGLGELGDLGILGSILGGLGDTGVFEDLGTLGRVLQALSTLRDLTGEMPTSVDELFNLILGQIPGEWQVERGTDDSGTRWVSLSRSFSNLDELEQIMSEGVITSLVPMKDFNIQQDSGFFGTKTVFSTSLNPEDAMSKADAGSSSLPADLLETVLVIQNRLTLPGDIKDNNADQIEGNTLVWNIGLSGETEMYAESVVRNWGAVIGVTIGAVVALGLIVLLIVLLIRRRRQKADSTPPPSLQNGEATVQAAESGQTAGAMQAGGERPSAEPADSTEVREPTNTDPQSAAAPPPVAPPPVVAAAPVVAAPVTPPVAAVPVAPTVVAPPDESALEGTAPSPSHEPQAVEEAHAAEETTSTAGEVATGNALAEADAARAATSASDTERDDPPEQTTPETPSPDPRTEGAQEDRAENESNGLLPRSQASPPPAPTPIPLRPSRLPAEETEAQATLEATDSADGHDSKGPEATQT